MKKTYLQTRRKWWLIGLTLVICQLPFSHAVAQERCHYEAADSILIEQLLADNGVKGLEKGQDVLYFARKFLGKPYVAHTLELYPDDERLVLNTRELDCTTYVDVVVALTLCSRRGETTFRQFVHQLHMQRYWNGVCDGYPSRIHYFTDWMRDNSRLGFVTEIQSPNPPFTALQKVKVDYMTKHPQSYVALKKHPEYLPRITAQEQDLTGRKYRYIPTRQLADSRELRHTVSNGDIIAITSLTPGLDIAHLGIAVWHDDGLHMIDASSKHKKVVEESITMQQYLKNRKNADGIRIVRLR
ncbi:MAG: DUF1460 domain-containing protein [Prevotella sp.]|jgi:hypothetical protein|nr:DUF1460 domain-containing protein [Prevotella sp.]